LTWSCSPDTISRCTGIQTHYLKRAHLAKGHFAFENSFKEKNKAQKRECEGERKEQRYQEKLLQKDD
jgi:hypothetical protein